MSKPDIRFIAELEEIVQKRLAEGGEESYTARLAASGTKRVAQKVGEEGVELALAATSGSQQETIDEAADLVYHLIVLLNDETGELEPAVSRNRKGTKADEKLSVSRTILDYVLQHKEGVLTSDAKEDERWDPANSILNLGVREAICVPMQGRYGIVNLIPYNTVDDLPYRRPATDRARKMSQHLHQHKVLCKLRRSAGQDVEGACGQLRARTLPERESLAAQA